VTKRYLVAVKVGIEGEPDDHATLSLTEYTMDEAIEEVHRLSSKENMDDMPHRDSVESISFHIIQVDRVKIARAKVHNTGGKPH
jgi:hypothetical protein